MSKMNNWTTEYKVDFHIFVLTNGKKVIEYNSLIIEGTSRNNVEQLVNAEFANVAGFAIEKIIKIWEY